MHLKRYLIYFFILTSPSGFLLAEIPKCSQITNISFLSKSIIKNHPKLKVFYEEEKQKNSLKLIANQTPNLEINSKLLYGLAEPGHSIQLGLNHTFELGSKKSVRTSEARLKLTLFQKQLIIYQQEALLESILDLYSYRQLSHEIEMLNEDIETFTKVIARYRKLRHRDPKQKVSLYMFILAREEHSNEVELLLIRQSEIVKKLENITGCNNLNMKRLSPSIAEAWPKIKPVSQETLKSPLLEIAQTNTKLSESILELKKSQAWPNLSIGPSVTYEKRQSTIFDAGVNFKFTVPLYHQNQGEKKYAKLGIKVAKTKMSSLQQTLISLRHSYLATYNKAIKNLLTKNILKIYKGKHNSVHNLANRGLVSANLMIELHRQEVNLIRSFHQREMAALHALWNIHAIDGNIFKVTKSE